MPIITVKDADTFLPSNQAIQDMNTFIEFSAFPVSVVDGTNVKGDPISFRPCTENDFEGLEDKFAEMNGGQPDSMFCVDDKSSDLAINQAFGKSIQIQFNTCNL